MIFDCDGVLVDSEPLAARVNAELLAELGWPLSEAEAGRRFIGCSAPYFRAEVEAHIGRPMPAWWDARFLALFEEFAEKDLAPIAGVEQVVAALAGAGVARCVASNSRRERVIWMLRRTGLIGHFSEAHVFSGRDVAAPKPAPDLLLHASALLGVPPDSAVVVEDSRFGVEAARAAGMVVFGYAGGLTPASQLEGATEVFENMAQLPALLGLRPSAPVQSRGPGTLE
ncbi:MAG: HAD family phosphatase [Acidimicrobiaceae bacterium]|nr:HAD family phosphatase [Acidimicrobiaceae bacterium]MBO0747434.1 HAD family phosphatase [Acidimicrobiaceae bacterium]